MRRERVGAQWAVMPIARIPPPDPLANEEQVRIVSVGPLATSVNAGLAGDPPAGTASTVTLVGTAAEVNAAVCSIGAKTVTFPAAFVLAVVTLIGVARVFGST